MRRIGLLGGTFDPVHFGHLRPAVEIRAALALQQLRFLPCRVSPLRSEPAAAPEHRLAMLRLALDGHDDLLLDARELERPAPSYTVDTLEELRRAEPDARVHFMLGADAFADLDQWHEWQRILELAHLVVTRRPGVSMEIPAGLQNRITERRADLEHAPAGSILLQHVTQLDISATAIRRLAARGGDLRYLTPEPVLRHLHSNQLYRGTLNEDRGTG